MNEFEYDFVHVRAITFVLSRVWQNGIWSFRAMNVYLTASFKLLSF